MPSQYRKREDLLPVPDAELGVERGGAREEEDRGPSPIIGIGVGLTLFTFLLLRPSLPTSFLSGDDSICILFFHTLRCELDHIDGFLPSRSWNRIEKSQSFFSWTGCRKSSGCWRWRDREKLRHEGRLAREILRRRGFFTKKAPIPPL